MSNRPTGSRRPRSAEYTDIQRGVGAAFHLIRCLQWLDRLDDKPRTLQLFHIRQAADQMRTARGYLGAIGFEGGWRL